MKPKQLYLLLFCCLISSGNFAQQKIGLVLSGGGATGFSHIGVIKALEENEIPIDYITGTSAGALVGSMYSVGYSPEEIEAYVLSDDFQTMSNGDVRPDQHFLFREEEKTAKMVGLSLSKDSLFNKSLPTNFNSSAFIDYFMMTHLGTVSASVENDFDNLFVPFRCVASDIENKKSVTFKDGHLNAAVRASMTYPFFIKPTRIDGVLLFDGGLYNNFPADIMYEDFFPDFIIGSNVSYNAAPPTEDDLISQLTNMLVSHSDYSIPCEDGFIIKPETSVSTFDFQSVKQAIEDGYNTTIGQIDSLKKVIHSTRTKAQVNEQRKQFRARIIPLNVSSISSKTDGKELRYTRLSLIKSKKPELLSQEEFERRYFRLYATPQVDFIYPKAELKSDSSYNISLTVSKSKDFKIDVGGHISSRPVNTGYLGLTYQTIGNIITRSHVESYFGKFYGSVRGDFMLEFPAIFPISTTGYFTLNRWDYFRSFATFFEDVQPSFLVQNEIYAGFKLSIPVGNTMKSGLDFRYFKNDDRYYQTDIFSNKDTADLTTFEGASISWGIEKNTLNRKQFASSGHQLKFKARYVFGNEHSIPGSTSFQNFEFTETRSWINLNLEYQNFVVDRSMFHLGIHGQAVYNSRVLLSNYTATLLTLNDFNLLPDASTYFLPEYRSPQFGALGFNAIFSPRKNIDLRLDGYLYQPLVTVQNLSDGSTVFSDYFDGRTFVASASAIYHSFVGPIRATMNYYPEQVIPWSLQFSFGYVLFNERSVR